MDNDVISSPRSKIEAGRCGDILLQTFDLIQVINLKERRDRKAEIEREFQRIGLSFDLPQLTFLDASRFEEPGNFDSIGARGCFDSHVRAMDTARNRGARTTLIVEDDCDFSRHIDALLPKALAGLATTNWSIFYGGHLGWDGELDATPPVSLAKPKEGVRGTHMIGLTIEAIDLALPYLKAMRERPNGSPEGGPMHVDGAYCWFRTAYPHLETWAASPMLGYQRPSRTDIHPLGIMDATPGLRDITACARRVRHRFMRR